MAKSEISVWMPFYIDRFLSSLYVQSMTAEQRWWYVSILLRAWQADPPCLIPNDADSLRMFAGCIDLDAWAFRSAQVVARFSPVEGGRYLANPPQLVIYQQQLASLEKAKEKAAYAAEKRWEKERARKDAQTMLEQCSSNAQASKIGDKTMLEHEPSMTQAMLGDAIQKENQKEKEINTPLPPSRGARFGRKIEPGVNPPANGCRWCQGSTKDGKQFCSKECFDKSEGVRDRALRASGGMG